MKKHQWKFSQADRDRLIWQALTLALDAILSIEAVQAYLNEWLRTFDFAEMPKTKRPKRKAKP